MRAKFIVRAHYANGQVLQSLGSTRRNAIGSAQYESSTPGTTAEIIRLSDQGEQVIMRYWRDSDGLQFLEY